MSLQDAARQVLCNLSLLVDGRVVSLELAQYLIRESAYWYGHPHGPTPAPKHAENVTGGDFGWEIQFGANTFLVAEAVCRCASTIQDAATLAEKTGTPAQEVTLRSFLDMDVRESVAIRGRRLSGVYYSPDDFMHFGTQAIHVPSVISVIWRRANVHLIVG